MDDAPNDAPTLEGLPPNLRFLRLLVMVLTATMIAGLLVVIYLLVTRLPGGRGALVLPDHIALPDGVKVEAFTAGQGWVAVVTGGNEILIFDAGTGVLRQRVKVGE